MLSTKNEHFASVLRRMAIEKSEREHEIGRRIARARVAKGWNQPDLAQAIGVSPSTVSRWERGITTAYRQNARKIADALDVALDEIEPPHAEGSLFAQLDRLEEGQDRIEAKLDALLHTLDAQTGDDLAAIFSEEVTATGVAIDAVPAEDLEPA